MRTLSCTMFVGIAVGALAASPSVPAGGESIIPIIDISALVAPDMSIEAKQEAAHKIGRACEEVGFFVIQGHGISPETIGDAWGQTMAFFDQDTETKLGEDSHLLMTDEYPYGYSPFGGEVLAKGEEGEKSKDEAAAEAAGVGADADSANADAEVQHMEPTTPKLGDMKEMFAVGPWNEAAGMPAVRYPSTPVGMQAAWQAYYESLESLAGSLMQGFALALDLPIEWFERKFDKHASALRSLNYPDLTHLGVVPEPGQMRASAHTDYGVLTILKSGGPGLQVKGRDQQWHDVPYLEDAFVINLGDLMSRWTNDKWVSTPHRVINPPLDADAGSHRRQSMAFFANLNMDAEVKAIPTCVSESNPAKYPDTTAGEHLMAKHLASTQGILDDSWMVAETKRT